MCLPFASCSYFLILYKLKKNGFLLYLPFPYKAVFNTLYWLGLKLKSKEKTLLKTF